MNENHSEEPVVTETTPETVSTETPAPSQDPIEQELEKVSKKGEGRTELEKLQFTKRKLLEREAELLKEQGIAPTEPGDDEPVTVGMLKAKEREQAFKTALTLAEEDIQDERERELVKHHLSNTIKPSGNPREDLRVARAIVNSVKNGQIAEELARKGTPSAPSSSGAPGKHEAVFEPTPSELAMMRPPFNLTKEDVVKARQKEEESRR